MIEPKLQVVVLSVDPTMAGVRLKIGFAVMKLALPSPIDVPIAHRALHEFRPDWVELEIVRVFVGNFVKLRSKVMGSAVQIGDAGPNSVIKIPDYMYSFISH
ncbi:MAG TPA: hypothetical protein VGL12_16470 [Roseiarcus sp.]